jgi:hypothetical protein
MRLLDRLTKVAATRKAEGVLGGAGPYGPFKTGVDNPIVLHMNNMTVCTLTVDETEPAAPIVAQGMRRTACVEVVRQSRLRSELGNAVRQGGRRD